MFSLISDSKKEKHLHSCEYLKTNYFSKWCHQASNYRRTTSKEFKIGNHKTLSLSVISHSKDDTKRSKLKLRAQWMRWVLNFVSFLFFRSKIVIECLRKHDFLMKWQIVTFETFAFVINGNDAQKDSFRRFFRSSQDVFNETKRFMSDTKRPTLISRN